MEKFKTSPKHWLDRWLWPILRLFWEWLFIKQSHHWHWSANNAVAMSLQYDHRLEVEGDNEAKPRDGFWANLWQTNFGWNKVAILQTVSFHGEYQISFLNKNNRWERCSLILRERTAVLCGPDKTTFCAISADPVLSTSVKIEVAEYCRKKDLKKKGIPLI